jgi:putative tryptophan/tyrosine transport system substrate-binding protein
MRRRDFMAVLAAATVWMAPARGQETRHVIGFLSGFSDAMPGTLAAFYQGLKETGFVEGKNLSTEFLWAGGHYDRLPSLAAELVARNVSVIVAIDVPSSFAAKRRPEPFALSLRPAPTQLSWGLVDSFNQPRGNVTGVTVLLGSLGPKQLELLHELLSNSSKIVLLVNPSNPNSQIDTAQIQAAADALGEHLEVLAASTESELDTGFTNLVRQGGHAIVVKPDPFFISQREHLVTLAARHAIPAIYSHRVFVDRGGLMSYGGSNVDAFRQVGTYAGRILKGAKPVDLPIEQNTTFELVINLKAAKVLGLIVPPSLLARADEVIE